MAKVPGFRFATEVAPPKLVAVVKPRASKMLDTIPEEEMDSMEDQSCSSESILRVIGWRKTVIGWRKTVERGEFWSDI